MEHVYLEESAEQLEDEQARYEKPKQITYANEEQAASQPFFYTGIAARRLAAAQEQIDKDQARGKEEDGRRQAPEKGPPSIYWQAVVSIFRHEHGIYEVPL